MLSSVIRGIAAVGACALLLTLGSIPAQAGSISLSYSIGPGIAVEPTTGAWVGVGGSMGLTVTAFRATPSASFGVISGGTVSLLALAGGPTHLPPYGMTYWTIAGPPPAPGVPPVALPSLMGSFGGLNAAGTAFTAAGGFGFIVSFGPPNATVGQFNAAGGPGIFSGFFGITGGGMSGSGTAGICFQAVGAPSMGPCATAATASPFPSLPAAGTLPGFGALGTEIVGGRSVAIEPVPEPGTAALLGLGVLGLAGMARRMRS